MSDNLTQFKNPDSSYYGTDFWMLNDALSYGELLFQLGEMADKGTKSILVRTYSGLNSDYPGEDFKKKTHFIVENAKKLGINVFLQAKYMPECVLNLPKEYAVSHIVPKKKRDVSDTDGVICTYDGICFCICASDSIIDLFDKDAVDYYIKDCYEDMWADFEEFYGNAVSAVWVDEPAFGRANPPYPKNFFQTFEKEYGYDLKPCVYKLWYNTDGSKTVRYHYWSLISRLMEKNYFKRLLDWCGKKNLMFSGHLLGEDCLKNQIRFSGAIMPYYKYFDIPGIDILTMNANWNNSPVKQKPGDELRDIQRLYTTPIQVSSAANQAGNGEHILCEMYGASTENMTFKNQMYLFNRLAVYGVNHRSVHGIFYSLAGRRKRGYAPHINYYQPYWKKYKNMYDYCARAGKFLRFGNACADVLVLHPLETAYTLLNEKLPDGGDDTDIDRFDYWFFTLMSNLKAAHIEFDLGDFSTVAEKGSVTCGVSIRVGNMEYKTVVLPRLDVLSTPVYNLLKRFSDMGGNVICIGNPPSMLDGREFDFSDKINFEYAPVTGYIPCIKRYGGSYKIDGTDSAAHIIVYHRKDEENDYFMLMNTDCAHKKDFELLLCGKKQVKIWDCESGNTKSAYSDFDGENTVFCGTIEAGEGIFLSFENEKEPCKKPKAVSETAIELTRGWSAERKQKNVLLLEYCKYRTENAEFSHTMPILAVNEILYAEDKERDIELSFEFETDFEIEGMSLALEDIENCEILLNKVHIEKNITGFYIDKGFKTIGLPKCRFGKNEITVYKKYIPLSKTSKSLSGIFENSSGTELECMYLLGDFAVSGTVENCLNGCVRMNRRFTLTHDKKILKHSDMTSEGYPFYAGSAVMSKSVYIDEKEQYNDAFVYINCLNAAVAAVYTNGEFIGDISRGPKRLSCFNSLKSGNNVIEFELFSTLRNVFGPSHRPIGERGNTFGDTPSRKRGCYGYFDEPWIPMNTDIPGWQDNTDTDTDSWTSSYNLLSFGTDGVKLILCK